MAELLVKLPISCYFQLNINETAHIHWVAIVRVLFVAVQISGWIVISSIVIFCVHTPMDPWITKSSIPNHGIGKTSPGLHSENFSAVIFLCPSWGRTTPMLQCGLSQFLP